MARDPFLVLGSWFLVLGSWFLVLGSWFLVFGFWFLVFGFWFLVFLGRSFLPERIFCRGYARQSVEIRKKSRSASGTYRNRRVGSYQSSEKRITFLVLGSSFLVGITVCLVHCDFLSDLCALCGE